MLSEGLPEETPVVVTNNKSIYPKRRPIGEYDMEIICKKCEKIFGDWDDYAFKLLVKNFDNLETMSEDGVEIGYSSSTYNYEYLKLFCISVLWRAGVSNRDFFSLVNLGKHERTLREMILEKYSGTPDEYSVEFFRFAGFDFGVPIIMPVHITTTYGTEIYRVYLGRTFFDIKFGIEATPDNFGLGEISPENPLLIVNMNLKEMDEYRILKLVANSPQNENAI